MRSSGCRSFPGVRGFAVWPALRSPGRSGVVEMVSNWQTDADDVDRSVHAIVECYRAVRGG